MAHPPGLNSKIPEHFTDDVTEDVDEYVPGGIGKLFLLLQQIINGLSETTNAIAEDDQDGFGNILTLLLQMFDKPPRPIIPEEITPSQIAERQRPGNPGNPTADENHSDEDAFNRILPLLSQLFDRTPWSTPEFPETVVYPGPGSPENSLSILVHLLDHLPENMSDTTGGKPHRLRDIIEKSLPSLLQIFRQPTGDGGIDRPELGGIEKLIRLILHFFKNFSQTTPVYNPNYNSEYPRIIHYQGGDVIISLFELLNELSEQNEPMRHGINELSPFISHIIQHFPDGETIDESSTEWNSVEKLIILTLKIIKKLSDKFNEIANEYGPDEDDSSEQSGIEIFFPLLSRIINEPFEKVPQNGIEKLILLSLRLISDIFGKYSAEHLPEGKGLGKFVRLLNQITHPSGMPEYFPDDFTEDEDRSVPGGVGKLFLSLQQIINGLSETTNEIAEDDQDDFGNILTLLLQIFDEPPRPFIRDGRTPPRMAEHQHPGNLGYSTTDEDHPEDMDSIEYHYYYRNFLINLLGELPNSLEQRGRIFRQPFGDGANDRPVLDCIGKLIRLLLHFLKKSPQTTPVYYPNDNGHYPNDNGEFSRIDHNQGRDLLMLTFALITELSGQNKPMQDGIKGLSPSYYI
ncbi:hypothetical protein JTB14_037218 [Gonioctena quinquepunctata]|nr:hypothetical protein JTB14_037218 [Gonioctena quinquepunctata]